MKQIFPSPCKYYRAARISTEIKSLPFNLMPFPPPLVPELLAYWLKLFKHSKTGSIRFEAASLQRVV